MQLRGWDLEATIETTGEIRDGVNVNSAGQIYLGAKYTGEKVNIAFEVVEE